MTIPLRHGIFLAPFPSVRENPTLTLARDLADTAEWMVDHEVAVIGTPDDAIARIERLYAKQGDFGSVLLMGHNWADRPATERGMLRSRRPNTVRGNAREMP